ncbi:MAG: leucine-rich repeat domain-containing protein [Lachnospiraceae bacterium]|nr:leucine-rich repeat domain-containing protein [Ruminococcus sp.]MCM1277053.1 leucine-rich repeat domain-containing protein [Lachnospiraceae bacterium]
MTIIANGVCGDYPQAFWRVDDEGNLVIYGEGKPHISFKMPWDEYAQTVKTFTVERGITSISVELKNYTNLRRVEFSDTVRYNFCTFKGCVNLSEIVVSDTLEHFYDGSIEDTAWYGSQPDGPVYIGKIFYGFKGEYCGDPVFTVRDGTKGITRGSFKVKGIMRVNLPKSIVDVAQSDFTFDDDIMNMNIKSGRSAYRTWNWSFSDGILQLPQGGVKDFYQPGEQPWSSFRDNIKAVRVFIVADKSGYIGMNAFAECKSLREVSLENRVSVINTGAFKNCTSLRSVTQTDNTERIEKGAFSGCKNLTEISLPHLTAMSGRELVKFNEHNPVKYTVKSKELAVQKRKGCLVGGFGKNFSWTLDKSGTMTFFGEGEMPYDEKFFSEQGEFDRSAVKKLILDDRITVIGSGAFKNFSGLTEIVFPKGLNGILRGAFQGCCALKEIIIPDTVKSIMELAFESCRGLRRVVLPEGLKYIGNGSFLSCESLERIHLPKSLRYIGHGAFGRCEKLAEINIPENATVNGNILYGTLLEQNSPDEIFYHDGWVLGYARDPSEKILRFKKGTKKIVEEAFGNGEGYDSPYNITEVILYGDICEIGANAFACVTTLEKVTADCTFKRLGTNVFSGTPWLDDQPDGLVILANAVLKYKGAVPEKLTIPSEYNGRKITLIAPYCNDAYDKLRELEIGENVELVCTNAFSYSPKLEKVTIPASVKRIEGHAFFNCPMLKSVFIPPSVEKIENGAFGYSSNPEYKWNDPISSQYLLTADFTIICERGSAAEKYAADNGINIDYV